MQFIEARDLFLDAYLAQTGPRSDVWRGAFLSSLAVATGLEVAEVEELVCNWMLQLAMWHRQPGFLWIDPHCEFRSDGAGFEFHHGVLLRFGKSTARGASTETPRYSYQLFAVNRRDRQIRLPDSEWEGGASHWQASVSARDILAVEYSHGLSELSDHLLRRERAPVRLGRGWSVIYQCGVELVT